MGAGARWGGFLAVVAVVAGGVVPARPAGSTGTAGPVGSEASEPEAVPGVSAPGYETRYLVEPNPLNSTGGMALDGQGGLFVCQALSNRVMRLDLATGDLVAIANETDAQPLLVPDDMVMGPDGNLYVTNILGRDVVRISPDGKQRKVVGSNIGDGPSGANGIAFNAQGRLFATDLSFSDPNHPGGLWEVDPEGIKPAIPILRNLPAPEGFAFGPDGLAYVPMMFPGRIDVIDVDTRASRTLVDGFGLLVSLKVDGEGRLVVMETDTGRVFRVDRTTGERTLLAEGDVGLDNLLVAPDGTIYVSNFVRGNIRRVNEATGKLDPVLPERHLALPFSVSESPDGDLLVGDFTAVSRVRESGEVERLSRLLINDLQLLTPGVAQIGDGIYFSDFLPPDGRIVRLDAKTGERKKVASGFGYPWTVREGPGGHLLVVDQALGGVFDLDPATGVVVTLIGGLTSPSGLAYNKELGVAYVSDTGAGNIVAIDVATRRSEVVASGLSAPEGVAVEGEGTLLVVEGDAGRLIRVDLGGSDPEVATGLPTKVRGIGLPLMNYSSDVFVRPDGSVVVTGNANGSLIELRRP